MTEISNYKGSFSPETYATAMNTDLLLGQERPMFFVPAAGAQTLQSTSQKWSQWGPYMIVDEYTGWYQEALQLRQSAVIGDWSPINKFNLSGPDVHRFVLYIQTRGDLKDIEIGQSMYTTMVREDGKLVHDPLIWRTGEDTYRITPDQVDEWFVHIVEKCDFDVTIEDVRTQYALLSLQGPKSTAIIEAASNRQWSDVEFSRSTMATLDGVELEVVRTGFTGEIGYELMVPTDDANQIFQYLAEVGEPYDIGFLGNYTCRMTRAEAGLLMLHFDYQCAFPGEPGIMRNCQMDPEMSYCSPFELGLDYLVSLDRDDDFCGKEALRAEIEAGGPRMRMKGLLWDSDDVAELFAAQLRDAPAPPMLEFPHPLRPEAHPIVHDGVDVGWATSVCYSPTLRRVFSFGRMNKELCEVGNRVSVAVGGGDFPVMEIGAEVVDPPFVKRKRLS